MLKFTSRIHCLPVYLDPAAITAIEMKTAWELGESANQNDKAPAELRLTCGGHQQFMVDPEDGKALERILAAKATTSGSEHFRAHRLLADRLMDLIDSGQGDGAAADALRDLMDEPWRLMTDDEQAAARSFAARRKRR